MKTVVLVALSCCAALSVRAADFVLAEGGRLKADVVVPDAMNGVERYASEELAYHLEKAYGVRPAVLKESEAAKSAAASHVYLGATKAAKAAGLPGRELTDEERVVAVRGNALFLLGQDRDTTYGEAENPWPIASRGTLYAVYDFLETELGVCWLWPGPTGEVIPKGRDVRLSRLERGGVEPLAERLFYGFGYQGANGFSCEAASREFAAVQMKFLVRHRLGRRDQVSGGHAFGDWWKKYGKEHPEYFNLLCDGTRRPNSTPDLVTLCVSNPDVWKRLADDFDAWYKKTKFDRRTRRPVVFCYENDNAGLCTCPKCRAWDPEDERFAKSPYWNGSLTTADLDAMKRKSGWNLAELVGDNRWGVCELPPEKKFVAPLADRYLSFYNHVLAEVRKRHPDARAMGYAYENYLEAPKKMRVSEGVLIEFVPRTYFPYDREESDNFRRDWKGWCDAGARDLMLRPNYMLAGGNYPFDQGRVILGDFAFAYTNGMTRCCFDSLRGSHSAHALMDYALLRAFREPTRGYDRSRREMLAAFGPASDAAAAYFDAVRAHTEKWTLPAFREISWKNSTGGTLGGGSFFNGAAILADYFDDGFFPKMNGLLETAKEAAKGDAEVLARIGYLQKGLKDAELTRNVRVAQKRGSGFDEAQAALKAYRASVERDWICNFACEFKAEKVCGWWK